MTLKAGSLGTKYVSMKMEFWYQANDESIHLASGDHPGFHTTVNNKPGSERYHKNLFKKLQTVLEENGRWP